MKASGAMCIHYVKGEFTLYCTKYETLCVSENKRWKQLRYQTLISLQRKEKMWALDTTVWKYGFALAVYTPWKNFKLSTLNLSKGAKR